MPKQKKSRQHSNPKGYIEITVGKIHCSICNVVVYILQSQLLHVRRINLYRLKLQYSVEPAWKKWAGWRKRERKSESLVFNQTVRPVEWYYFPTLNCWVLAGFPLLPENSIGSHIVSNSVNLEVIRKGGLFFKGKINLRLFVWDLWIFMYCSPFSLIAYFTKFICVCYRINLTGGQWKKAVKRKSINQWSRVAAGIVVELAWAWQLRNLRFCWGQSQVISDDGYRNHYVAGLRWLGSLVVTVLSVMFTYEEGHMYFTLAWRKYFVTKC